MSSVGLTEQEAIAQAKNDIIVYTSTFNPMKNTVSGYATLALYLFQFEIQIPG